MENILIESSKKIENKLIDIDKYKYRNIDEFIDVYLYF